MNDYYNVALIITAILLFLSVPITAQTRRALIIGIGIQKDESWAKINGDKDIPYVQLMLKNADYIDVKALVNQKATKKGIVAAFKKLTSQCSVGDVVYIHFSGHGQLVTDVNGDEKDGWDEAWVPYDAYRKYCKEDKGEKHLIDDEINKLLTAIRNKIGDSGKLLVVVDACHSGDSSRGDDIDETVRGVKDEFVIPVKKHGKTVKASEQWITLSACKDYQLNQEIKSPKVGKLTYALYISAKKGTVDFTSIETIMNRHRSQLPQTPMLTGDTSKYNISDFLK
ncbi:caspase family protein [Prevotella sp. E9-3]|uniref:caspase family protein n=1 Tax=Prevotella sp. E9-3 TaxID=2913621 RepID=UPI001EDB688C|nr:caspase family protein [Prevotella sp. E9-3]UKK47309.1 caspase family protein [Prevotella sp. E9-3]